MATVHAMFTITDVGDLNGRNLIQRSFFTKEPWTGPNYNTVGDGFGIYHDKYCLPVTAAYLYSNTNKGVNNIFPDLVFEEGVQYTISGNWAQFRTDDKYNRMWLRIHHTDGTRVTITQPQQNEIWSSFSLTSTAGKTVEKITSMYSNTGVTYIEHFKLEIGNTATDWTPAPEDVSTALDDAKEAKELANSKNSVYYQASAPTGNLKVGDTWFNTDNGYKISRWDGSTWAAAELGDQAVGNLNASHINAGTLTAVDIEAGKAQDIAGTIKVYDEDDAVKVSLDKDGLTAAKGKIGNWNISSYSIQYQKDVPSSEDTAIGGDEDEQLIESGTPQYVGGATLKLKICTYDPDNPNLGPHIISSVVENGVAPQYDNGKTMRISNGGLACYYNRNTETTGGSVNINPKLISVGSGEYDEDQVLWRDSANLNPGSLVIACFKTESGEQEQQLMGRSYLTCRDLSFVGDSANPQLASGIAHWSVLAARRTIKDELGVTIYHCGNLFWAHFDGKMTVGWRSRMEEYISIYPDDDASFTNSKLCAPPNVLEKYCMPQSPANPRAIYRVFPDGQLGLYHFIPPTNGDNNYEVLTYDNWEPCDIFWAHIG